MKSTTIKTVYWLLLFSALVVIIHTALKRFIYDISSAAPDALHFIGFVALIPMISSVGGRLATRKITYIKNGAQFTPAIIATFIITYVSLLPWVASFFLTENSFFIYIDWSIVLASIVLSFVLFSALLAVFLRK